MFFFSKLCLSAKNHLKNSEINVQETACVRLLFICSEVVVMIFTLRILRVNNTQKKARKFTVKNHISLKVP